MSKGQSTLTVFIWYPGSGRVGHCSCYIGDLNSNKIHNPLMNVDERRKKSMMIERKLISEEELRSELPSDPNYVSWWPKLGTGASAVSIMFLKQQSQNMPDLAKDIFEERGNPHVVYTIFGLSISLMLNKWSLIKNKYEHVDDKHTSYSFGGKNCAQIVMRVLKAGGVKNMLAGGLRGYWLSHSGIWTPKKVAMVCDELKRRGHAEKKKSSFCPKKGTLIFESIVGLR